MSIKLAELQAQCNLTVSIMDQTADLSRHSLPDTWKEQLAGLKALQTKIGEVHVSFPYLFLNLCIFHDQKLYLFCFFFIAAHVQAEQKRGYAEILSHQLSNGRGPQAALGDGKANPDASRDSGDLTPPPPATPASPATLAEFQQHEETHTLQQAELNQELRVRNL